MTIRPGKQCESQASVLLVALGIAFVLGVGIASYLLVVQSQYRMVAKSQSWNTALALAEAGIEEGLAQVNVSFGTNFLPSLQANWGAPNGGVYGPRTNAMANGYYSVVIIPSSPGPTIIATGYANIPALSLQSKRTVQVATTDTSAYGQAVAALQNVTMNGNNLMVDSYDSADTNYSNAQGNYDAAKRKAGGDVSTSTGILDVGNANIFGHVRTAPLGTASTGPNGRVGDLPANWNGQGIEPGWFLNDFNAIFPDVTVPFTNGTSVTKNKTGTNTYVLSSGDYLVNGNFSVGNNETLYVSGPTRLYVTGNFTMQGQNGSYITISPGATLQLYVGTTDGPSVSTTLLNVNNAGNASNFQYYGLPNNTSVTWSGNATYTGTVYAPEAQFTLTGGGNGNTSDYQGSCIVSSVVMNGHFNFHYDENLKRSGTRIGFTVAFWQEL
ncbi:MAG: hypothetical protein DME25_03245 [Verrucomicrobia bacterium]|nr:MAG: hypothetical protein DME25_03245 [Verrucomicrobiota bacterium]